MIVYDMGIVDYYNGMMPLLDYIKICRPITSSCESNYLTYRELKGFLIKCFMEVLTSNCGWEGDIRGLDEIAISAIPRPTGMTPYKFLVFKQDNNGQSFLVSECEIDILYKEEGCECINDLKKNIDPQQLMTWFYHCFDLVESLFDRALNDLQQSAITYLEDKAKEQKLPKDNFNLDNYESL